MKRRTLLAAPFLAAVPLAGCSSFQRPYVEKRLWPLVVAAPPPRQPAPHGPVLLVRTVRAAPGLEGRGLLTLRPDGSLSSDAYEEWVAPPAQAVEDQLRRWLAGTGQFAAVLAPGSRLTADLVLEGELTALWAEPGAGTARASLGYVVLDVRHDPSHGLLQNIADGRAPLEAAAAPGAAVAAELVALADAFRQIAAQLAALRA